MQQKELCSKCKNDLTTNELEFGWGDTCFYCVKNKGSRVDQEYLKEYLKN